MPLVRRAGTRTCPLVWNHATRRPSLDSGAAGEDRDHRAPRPHVLSALFARSNIGERRPQDPLLRGLSVFFVGIQGASRAFPEERSRAHPGSPSWRREPRGRAREQRRLSSEELRGKGDWRAGNRPRGGPRPRRGKCRDSDHDHLLHERTGLARSLGRNTGRRDTREQRPCSRSRLERIRGGYADAHQRQRCRRDRGPVSEGPHRSHRVRHDLSPAPVLLLGDGPGSVVSAALALSQSDPAPFHPWRVLETLRGAAGSGGELGHGASPRRARRWAWPGWITTPISRTRSNR